MSCNKITNGSEVSDGQGRIRLTGATPGRVYIISVKYSTKSLEGLSTGSSSNNCENNFVAKTTLGSFGSGTIVPNSQGSIKAKAGCSVPNDDDDDDHDDDDDFSNKASSFETDINNKELTVSSSPNPASTHFILSVKSNASTPVSVRITDITGRPVYNTTNLNMKNALYVGHNWQPGTYFAEVIQDKKRQVIKLIKL
ncbi:MAG: T9SS type A sorting domain-containing protein [Ferruginibacter sp.]